MTIIKCLHEDKLDPAIKAVFKQNPKLKKQYLEVSQVFNAKFEDLREIPDEHAPIRKT